MNVRFGDPDVRRTVIVLDPALRRELAEIARLHERTPHAQIRWALREHAERQREPDEATA